MTELQRTTTINVSHVGPHPFEALKFTDRFVKHGRCKACFFIRESHPMTQNGVRRLAGDESKAMFE